MNNQERAERLINQMPKSVTGIPASDFEKLRAQLTNPSKAGGQSNDQTTRGDFLHPLITHRVKLTLRSGRTLEGTLEGVSRFELLVGSQIILKHAVDTIEETQG